jgi:hypothetical protein
MAPIPNAMTQPPIERRVHGRKPRNLMQRRADAELAQHTYRLELVGPAGALDWPSICANCGVDTHATMRVRKVFVRPRAYHRIPRYRRRIIAAMDVPYCAECEARHRALVPPRSFVGDAWRMLWPVLIPMFGSGWFFLLTLRIALEEQARGGLNAKYVWGMPALFGIIFVWCLVVAWFSSRAARVDRQTEITRACDFSDDVSWFWERERRIYALRNERFARGFADANARRLWTEDDDRRSSRIFTTSLAVLGVVAVVIWMGVVFAPL